MNQAPAKLAARSSSVSVRGLSLLGLVLFSAWFYSFSLPNNQYQDGSPIVRWDLWRVLPLLLEQNVFPATEPGAPPAGWRYLPQRFDLLLVAGVILAGAWGLGHLTLRAIRLLPELTALERTVFAFALGLSGLSLLTMATGVAGFLNRWVFFVVLSACPSVELWMRRPAGSENSSSQPSQQQPREYGIAGVLTVAIVTPFVLAMLLGSMLPPTDFDVKEYHLEGPKEYFLQGRVTFLPHNVYTSFPFLTEMLALLAMVLRGDWFRGALAGQAVLMAFAPLTAMALFAAGRRWFSSTVGWMAVLVYLTTPWVYRISIIAYTEGGLSFFLFATVLAVLLKFEAADDHSVRRFSLLAGLMAGSAVACKYPGVISVAIPLGAAVVLGSRPKSTMVKTAATFFVGTLITFGPWMLKNLAETGNPVYPLLYTVFGGADWNDAMNAKWRAGHAAPLHLLREPSRIIPDLWVHTVDVIAKSDWQSPLVFGLAPLALFWRERRRLVLGLWAYVLWLFFTWWMLTHRIDRFWVPMLPVMSLLAGVGLGWLLGAAPSINSASSEGERTSAGFPGVAISWVGAIVVSAAVLFNLGFITSPLCGFNAYLTDLPSAAQQAATPSIRLLNELPLPEDARVLMVGEAEVFDARFDYVYNTVFDESIFQQWTSAAAPDANDGDQPFKSAEEILATFKEHGITHVFVNWQEILRYRAPGSYGYTDFVTPERFHELKAMSVLQELPLDARLAYLPWENLSTGQRALLEPSVHFVRKSLGGVDLFQRYQLFAVRHFR